MPLYRTISVGTTSTVIVPTTSVTGSRWVTVKNVGQQPVTIGNDVLGPGVDRNYFLSDTQTLNAVTSGGTTTVEVADAQASTPGEQIRTGSGNDVVLESWVTGEAYPRYRLRADGRSELGGGTASPVDLLGTYAPPTSGIETFPRNNLMGSSLSNATQRLTLTFFTAPKSASLTTMEVGTGTTAAATVTSVFFGLYSEDPSSGDLTLVASTENDTSLMIATSTVYSKAFQASVDVVRGRRYATAVLQVASTVSTYNGINGALSSFLSRSPRVAAIVNSQTSLPATIASGSLSASSNLVYTYLS